MKVSSRSSWGKSLLSAAAGLACSLATITIGGATADTARAAAEVAGQTDFSGIWRVINADRVVLPGANGNGKRTSEAQAQYDHYLKYYPGDVGDPAIHACLAKGMPWQMLSRGRNYPVEIYQTADRVIMFFELYDLYRNIRIDGPPKPDNYAASASGYSVARWEGDTLVIETTGLSPFNPIGPFLRSGDARITERWTLKQDPEHGKILTVDLLQNDPNVYAEPARGHTEWEPAEPGTVVGGYGCTSDLWDQYVADREAELEADGK